LAYAKWLKCTDRTISESLVSRFELHMVWTHIVCELEENWLQTSTKKHYYTSWDLI